MELSNIFKFKRALAGEEENTKKANVEQPSRGGLNAPLRLNYMNVPTVNRCVNLLASRLFSLGLRYEAYDGQTWTPIDSNMNYLLSVEPDSAYSAPNFFKALVADYLLNGEAFIIPKRVGSIISRLCLVESKNVSYNDSDEEAIYTVTSPRKDLAGRYKESEILHIVNFSFDGRRGRGFKDFAIETAKLNALCDAKTVSQFNTPDAFIKSFADNKRFDIEEFNKVGRKLQQDFGSAASIIVQPQLTQFEVVPVPNTKSNSVEVKTLAIQDICRFFNIPPAYAFDSGGANYKESAQASYQMAEAVLPIANAFEAEFNRKLIQFEERGTRRFHYNMYEAYSNADPNTVADYFLKALQAGILTPNEIRKACNRRPVAGGDELFISANLTTPDALAQKVHSEAGLTLESTIE